MSKVVQHGTAMRNYASWNDSRYNNNVNTSIDIHSQAD